MKDAIFLGLYTALPSAHKLGIRQGEEVVAWQAWQSPASEIFLQGVDTQGVMVGSVFEIMQEDLQNNFVALEQPAANERPLGAGELSASDPSLLDHWLALAQSAHSENTVSESPADHTSENALGGYSPEADEENYIFEEMIRAEFSSLLEQWQEHPTEANLAHLRDIIDVQGDMHLRQKIMFSEFGLILRKNCLHDLALQSHKRALQLDPHDPRVLFNIARSQTEVGQHTEALENLHKALNIDSQFQNARAFLEFLQGKSL